MAQIFPKWTNQLPLYIVMAVLFLLAATVGFFWYYGSPYYTDVGYRPTQPIPYSHKLHAGDLGMDCRYCHTGAEVTHTAGVPPTQTCLNCHRVIKPDSEKILPIQESWDKGIPIQWVRVHKVPDYAYFDHSIHLSANVGCSSCHGRIDQMDVVTQMKPLSMKWCLDCHRNPVPHLRPEGDVTNMNWKPGPNQKALATALMMDKHMKPPTDCSGCHR